jgi:predicted  nucleic acid-binding Zn-ribbon protein
MDEIRSLEDLLDLQREDSAIDRLLERRQSLPELAAYREAHDTVAELDEQVTALEQSLREDDLAIDKAEGEMKLGEDKLEREERRLFAGGLTAKEAEHLRQEVEMLRRRSSEAETEILQLLEGRDETQQETESLRSERETATAEKERLEAIIQKAWKEIDADIARHEAKKAEIAPLIPADLMEMYEGLRPHKEGVAVARLGEGVCGGCHLALSAAEQTEVLREDPPRCLHCRRILVKQ